jgi:hypothetical protein
LVLGIDIPVRAPFLSLLMKNWDFGWIKDIFEFLEASALQCCQDVTLIWQLFSIVASIVYGTNSHEVHYKKNIYSLWY